MTKKEPPHSHAAFAAVGLVVGLFALAGNPSTTSAGERRALAARYKFERIDLPAVKGPEPRNVRTAHPTCQRISAWISSIGAGATLADLDGDGLPNDLIYTDPRTEQVIVCPAPGTPARYAPFALCTGGHDRPNVGCAGTLVGDFNEDGLPDVLVHFMGRPPLLFLRKTPMGSGLSAADFEVIDLTAEVKDARWFTMCAVQADLDGDGHPDLVFGNYFPDGSDTYNPEGKGVQVLHDSHGWACNGGGVHFFHWKKPTAESPYWFEEVKTSLSERAIHGWTLALGVADLDGDMLPEVYVANDLGQDRLYHNLSKPGKIDFEVAEGQGGFSSPGAFSLGLDTYHGMGCDFADLNHDGVLDIFVSNITSPYGIEESNFLWLSQPRALEGKVARFEQASERWGLSRSGWAWDAKFESFANQVEPDLVQACGMIKGTTNRWPELQSLSTGNTLFLNDPRNWPRFAPGNTDIAGSDPDAFFVLGADGKYHNVNGEVGLGEPMVSRSIATADVDGGGRVDFAVANMWGPSYFFKNACPDPGRWVGLKLVLPLDDTPFSIISGRPPVKGRPAFGARATVNLPGGPKLLRQVDGGNGHGGRRAPEMHFGLGKLDASVKTLDVELRWRQADGQLAKPVTIQVEPDHWHTVVLGKEQTR